MEENILHRAMQLQRESEETENQINFVNEQVSELESFNQDLGFLKNNREGEVLAPLGKGVFMKTGSNKKDEKFFVDVGAGVILRKTPEETMSVIKEQLKKFNEVKLQLTSQLENYASQFKDILKEIEKMKEEK